MQLVARMKLGYFVHVGTGSWHQHGFKCASLRPVSPSAASSHLLCLMPNKTSYKQHSTDVTYLRNRLPEMCSQTYQGVYYVDSINTFLPGAVKACMDDKILQTNIFNKCIKQLHEMQLDR